MFQNGVHLESPMPMQMLESNDGILYCVKSGEGTFYSRDQRYIRQYLTNHFLQDPMVFELSGDNLPIYLGTGKTYLKVLTDSDII